MEFIIVLRNHVLGIIIGGWVLYKFISWRSENNEIKQAQKNQLMLKENINRIRDELKHNVGIIRELTGVFETSHNPKYDGLELGKSVVDSFLFISFKKISELVQTNMEGTSLCPEQP